jgi:formylglycine-generating enzyme required for sulfatase activity
MSTAIVQARRSVRRAMLSAWLLAAASGSAQPAEPPRRFVDCVDCPTMVHVPAGRYTMGVLADEEDREQLADAFRGRSEPRRTVAVAAFAIGVHEVTRKQFRRFVEATGYRAEGCFVWRGRDFVERSDRSWQAPGFPQDDDHPAVCVSWNDAQAYVRWLSEAAGRRYRLPSEAEWEYAARAGSRAIRFWGDDPARACGFANGADESTRAHAPDAVDATVHPCRDGHAHTAPAGRFRPNAFGVYDMLGNAAEWTQDCWRPDYRDASPDAAAAATGDCALRVVRGGAWDEGPAGLRVAYRVGSPTTVRVYGRGFRVARD